MSLLIFARALVIAVIKLHNWIQYSVEELDSNSCVAVRSFVNKIHFASLIVDGISGMSSCLDNVSDLHSPSSDVCKGIVSFLSKVQLGTFVKYIKLLKHDNYYVIN